jgi:predicted TIM-barrel fold metal-dependent hydrolase
MISSARKGLERLLAYLEANASRLVIDADAHATNTGNSHGALDGDYYHGRPVSAEDLIGEMDGAGVDMALIWQNPGATVYPGDIEGNTRALLEANRYVRDAASRYPARFIPAGWVDPKGCGVGNALDMAELLVEEFGFSIVKLNPAQNRFPIDGPEVAAVVDRIVQLGATPAFHFGADTPYTPAAGLRRVAERHPGRPVLAVHMGGGGAGYLEAEQLYAEARALGLACPDIHYVLSAKRETHIESDLIAYQRAGAPFRGHLFCGSDAPFGRMAWNFGGYRAMFQSLMRARPGLFTPEAAQDYMGGNFARFAAAGCRSLLCR